MCDETPKVGRYLNNVTGSLSFAISKCILLSRPNGGRVTRRSRRRCFEWTPGRVGLVDPHVLIHGNKLSGLQAMVPLLKSVVPSGKRRCSGERRWRRAGNRAADICTIRAQCFSPPTLQAP